MFAAQNWQGKFGLKRQNLQRINAAGTNKVIFQELLKRFPGCLIPMHRLIAGLLLLWSLPLAADWHSDQQDLMGTRVSVSHCHDKLAKGRAAVSAVMAEMRRIDAEYSPYIETIQLSRANRLAPLATAKEPLVISAELS